VITFYGVPGTWALFDWGFQADVARELPGTGEWDAAQCEILGEEVPFRWQGVNYYASFGPVNPPPWAPVPAPSYEDSVVNGVAHLTDMINNTPGQFVLSGYSQGAEVTGRVRNELVQGSLRHRARDCLLSITFGDPTRQPEDEAYGGGAGAGISRMRIPPGPFRCVTYAVTGDMYCTTPNTQAGDDMHAVYEALTSMGGDLQITDLVTEVMRTMTNPIAGGMAAVEAIIRALKVGAHGNYGPWVDHAAAIVKSLAL
jgi:hypothetical protein